MTRHPLMALAALAAATLISCDDTTDTLGQSLTPTADIFSATTDTFELTTRSIVADSVLSRAQYSYLGHVKDTETGTYVTAHFTSQFTILEDIYAGEGYFPVKDSIASRDANGDVVAESCQLRVYLKSFVGDSLNTMKLTAYELAKPITATASYYTNFDPLAAGYVRTDAGAIKRNKLYTPLDLNLSDSVRNLLVSSSSTYYKPITISLNDEYTDRQGNTYNNYGTYLLRTYYAHPEYYKNSITFANHVCPGFYFKSTGGLGVMSEVYMTSLDISFKYQTSDTTTATAISETMGTEEIMRTTSVENNRERLSLLASDDSCTYLKAPAGIFTEVTLPVEQIMNGHESDTLSSAKIVFQTYQPTDDDNQFDAPDEVMIMPKDSLYQFFENGDLPDNVLYYVTTHSSTYNTYTFSNIAGLVSTMWRAKGKSDDWNKAVLVPVTRNYSSSSSSSSSSSTLVSVSNEMALKSVRLVKGYSKEQQAAGMGGNHAPVTISVIYNKFND